MRRFLIKNIGGLAVAFCLTLILSIGIHFWFAADDRLARELQKIEKNTSHVADEVSKTLLMFDYVLRMAATLSDAKSKDEYSSIFQSMAVSMPEIMDAGSYDIHKKTMVSFRSAQRPQADIYEKFFNQAELAPSDFIVRLISGPPLGSPLLMIARKVRSTPETAPSEFIYASVAADFFGTFFDTSSISSGTLSFLTDDTGGVVVRRADLGQTVSALDDSFYAAKRTTTVGHLEVAFAIPKKALIQAHAKDVILIELFLLLICSPGVWIALRIRRGLMESEQERERARVLSETFADVSDEAVWIASGGMGKVYFVNKGFSWIYGVSTKKFIEDPMTYKDRIVDDDRIFSEMVFQRLRPGDSGSVEYRVKDDDGNTRWIREIRRVMPGHAWGEIEVVVCSSFDISAQKAKENELTASRQLMDARCGELVAQKTAAVAAKNAAERNALMAAERSTENADLFHGIFLTLDDGGHILSINQDGHRTLSDGQSSMVGAEWFRAYIPIETRERERAIFKDLVSKSGKAEYLGKVSAPDQILDVEWRLSAYTAADGRVEVAASGELVTELRQATKTIERITRENLYLLSKSPLVAWRYSPQQESFISFQPSADGLIQKKEWVNNWRAMTSPEDKAQVEKVFCGDLDLCDFSCSINGQTERFRVIGLQVTDSGAEGLVVAGLMWALPR